MNDPSQRDYESFFLAATVGDIETLNKRLNEGVNVDLQDYGGWTALHYATMNGHVAAVRAILEKGASINSRNGTYHTPLMMAAECGHANVVELLLRCGADVNAKDYNDLSALHFALEYGATPKFQVAQLLLRFGADIDARDSEGRTVLHRACWNSKFDEAQFLLQNGADVNVVDRKMCKPLDLARQRKNDIVGGLLAKKPLELVVSNLAPAPPSSVVSNMAVAPPLSQAQVNNTSPSNDVNQAQHNEMYVTPNRKRTQSDQSIQSNKSNKKGQRKPKPNSEKKENEVITKNENDGFYYINGKTRIEEHDVVMDCGRGGFINFVNKGFAELIREYQEEYTKTRSNSKKNAIAKEVFDKIKAKGGRFLDSSGINVAEKDYQKVKKKIMHALRVKKPPELEETTGEPAAFCETPANVKMQGEEIKLEEDSVPPEQDKVPVQVAQPLQQKDCNTSVAATAAADTGDDSKESQMIDLEPLEVFEGDQSMPPPPPQAVRKAPESHDSSFGMMGVDILPTTNYSNCELKAQEPKDSRFMMVMPAVPSIDHMMVDQEEDLHQEDATISEFSRIDADSFWLGDTEELDDFSSFSARDDDEKMAVQMPSSTRALPSRCKSFMSNTPLQASNNSRDSFFFPRSQPFGLSLPSIWTTTTTKNMERSVQQHSKASHATDSSSQFKHCSFFAPMMSKTPLLPNESMDTTLFGDGTKDDDSDIMREDFVSTPECSDGEQQYSVERKYEKPSLAAFVHAANQIPNFGEDLDL